MSVQVMLCDAPNIPLSRPTFTPAKPHSRQCRDTSKRLLFPSTLNNKPSDTFSKFGSRDVTAEGGRRAPRRVRLVVCLGLTFDVVALPCQLVYFSCCDAGTAHHPPTLSRALHLLPVANGRKSTYRPKAILPSPTLFFLPLKSKSLHQTEYQHFFRQKQPKILLGTNCNESRVILCGLKIHLRQYIV